MNKYWKAGLLTLLLVLPALIVLFLNFFAENHFSLPYYNPIVDSTGQVLINGKDTVFYKLPDKVDKKIEVVGFFADSSVKVVQQFSRLQKLAYGDLFIHNLTDKEVEKIANEKYKITNLIKNKKTIPYYYQFILIDKQGYIRGKYEANNPEDVDRLIAEIKILRDIYKKQ